MRVLIVEADPQVRARVGEAVVGLGHCPMFAQDGRDALDLMSVLDPHLIVAGDVPAACDEDLFTAVRTRYGATFPILAVSTDAASAVRAALGGGHAPSAQRPSPRRAM